jgi:hypothetical protein
MDTVHNPILHFGSVKPENAANAGSGFDDLGIMVSNRATQFVVRDTDFGCTYGAYRPFDEENTYWRTMHWLFPIYSMSPVPKLGTTALFGATVPIDDNHCMSWQMIRHGEGFNSQPFGPSSGGRQPLPNTTDWLGRFRNALSLEADNDFGMDREVQKAAPPNVTGFSGLRDINTQDEAMRWSQGRLNGGIVDRSLEHLSQTDAMIIRFRRRIIEAAKALAEQGTTPPGVDTPDVYRVRSGWIILPKTVDWWEGSAELRDAFKHEKVEIAATIPVS